MAGRSIDNFAGLFEEAFRKKEGLKEFLEVVLERIMAAEVDEHLGGQRHERSETRQG